MRQYPHGRDNELIQVQSCRHLVVVEIASGVAAVHQPRDHSNDRQWVDVYSIVAADSAGCDINLYLLVGHRARW